jgi:deoxyribose-phosphate aldolase
MNNTLKSIAKMIDHSLLNPQMTDRELDEGCKIAVKYDVASVCIKPYAIELAKGILKSSDVKVGTVIGFPHGSNHIDIKIKESEKALEDGAEELDMVVNIGKVLSKDWDYISREIEAVNRLAVERNAIVKVIFENDFLNDDQYKIKLCKICNLHAVAFVKTSTGYGFVKKPDGNYNYDGATDKDLLLMRRESIPSVQVKAAGKIRTLDDVLRVREFGVTRVGATTTAQIISQAKERGFS